MSDAYSCVYLGVSDYLYNRVFLNVASVCCRWFFGSDYDDVCRADDASFECSVALPPRNKSIMNHVFATPNDLPLLDRFLFVEYESPASESP